MPNTRIAVALLAFLLPVSLAAQQTAPTPQPTTERTYAIRSEGRVIGYQIETETPTREGDRDAVRFAVRSLVKLELLGQSFEQRSDHVWVLQADSRRALSLSGTMTAGEQRTPCNGRLTDAGFELDGGQVLDPARTIISPEFGWLAERGPKQVGEKIAVDYLLPELNSAQQAVVTFLGERSLTVQGKETMAREYAFTMSEIGTEFTVSVDSKTNEVLRSEVPAIGMIVERADPKMIERIERVDLTSGILAKTNLDYTDPSQLTFLRVKARIETTIAVTREGLDVPGQRFEGTVENGVIDGVFEIRPMRTDGAGAPPFPVPEGTFAAPELQPYLASEVNIESDHAGLAAKARELAEGASDCFAVLDRLSRWTGDIPYVIPGGGSAARTFELRAGECGGHSRVLAAMLRSLGIPARTPMGGMYVPLYGGCFAQHMWTEVWLGERIGWLPVDCTAGQWTYVDAGHIRLSEHLTAFRPQSVEVLDHEPKVAHAVGARRTDAFPWQTGAEWTYVYRAGGKDLGEEKVTYRGKQEDGGHLFTTAVALAGGRLVEDATTVVGADGSLRRFVVERTMGKAKTTFEATLDGDRAKISRKSDDEATDDTVQSDAASFVLQNNNTTHFAILVNRVVLPDDGEVRVRMLHVEQRSPLPLTLRKTGRETITIGEHKLEATVVAASIAGVTFTLHVDDNGRLLRFAQGANVTIELQQP